MSRKFAAFDIDGTLIRWQLYHAVADELARRGHLDPIAYDQVREARRTWKKRANNHSFDDYELALVRAYDGAITNIPVSEVEQAFQAVLNEYKDQVYTYTRDLIQQLKEQNYLLFAISGSQKELVEKLADYYGFDDCGGSVYEVSNGQYTGNAEALRSSKKPEYLKQLVAKHGASWQGSIAVGDSESDIPMLSIVERPLAFNPTAELFSHAKKSGWQIVVERKNVQYLLKPDEGTYKLGS